MLRSRSRVLVGAVGLAFVLASALGATGVFTPKSQRIALGASTTLTIISGQVQIRRGATGDFTAADDGAILGPGDTIRTGSDARAVLTYFEGSTVEIEPSSELAIQTAHGNPDGSTVIQMQQNLGSTWHVVTHLVQGGSKYEVRTTSATASVRGTSFTVGVEADQTTTVTTTEGNVAASDPAGTATVAVTPGLTTSAKKGEAPTPPKQAPEPERKVTVTVGDMNTLVVDTLGRANGITKDGKKIVQTPGAQVEVVDGKLVVTLPNVPDGDIGTHFQNTSKSEEVQVTTKVEEKGKKAVEVSEMVKPSETKVTGVEIKNLKGSRGVGSSDDTTVNLKKISDVKAPKVGEILPTPTTDDQTKAAEIEKSNKGSTSSTDSNSGNTETSTSSTSDAATKATNDDAKAKEAAAKQAEEAAKQAEEAAKQADEARKADEAKKADEARKAADAARKAADDAKKAADEAAKKAAEDAAKKKAADDAAKKAADDAARNATQVHDPVLPGVNIPEVISGKDAVRDAVKDVKDGKDSKDTGKGRK